MITVVKVYVKRLFPAPYEFLRRSLARHYFTLRNRRLSSLKDEQITTFKYAGIRFPIVINKENGFVDEEIYWKGCYEEDVLHEIRKALPPDGVFIDIGTNIGEHALFASYCAPKGEVFAFEPIPKLYKQCLKSIELNEDKLHSKINLHNTALSDHNGQAKIYLRDGNIGGSSLVPQRNTQISVDVTLRRGDELLENVKRVSLIKVDTEGHEYEALLGLEKTIMKHRPIIILEYSPSLYKKIGDINHSGKKLLSFLEKHGYEVRGIDESFGIVSSNLQQIDDLNFEQINILARPKNR